MTWVSYNLLFSDEAAAQAALYDQDGAPRYDPAVLSVAGPLALPVMRATATLDSEGNPVLEPAPGCHTNIRIRDGAVDPAVFGAALIGPQPVTPDVVWAT